MTLRDRHVFAAATAVVALHTITDAFVAREPGVEPADHVVSGLVPLALLAARRAPVSGWVAQDCARCSRSCSASWRSRGSRSRWPTHVR